MPLDLDGMRRQMALKKIVRRLDNNLRRLAPYRKNRYWFMALYRSLLLGNYRARRVFILESRTAVIDKDRYLFDSYFGKRVTCNPYAIFLGMESDRRFDGATFVWVVRKNTAIPKSVSANPRVRLVRWESASHAQELARCGTVIFNSTLPQFFSPKASQRAVATWHGVPLKAMGFDVRQRLRLIANSQRSFNISTTVLLPNEYAIENLVVGGFRAGLAAKKVVSAGSPRLDRSLNFFRASLPAADPIVLVALTWRPWGSDWGSSEGDYLDLAVSLRNSFGANTQVFFQIHNITARRFPRLQDKLPTLPPSQDLYEVISDVAVLISDYSSLVVDFLALKKPVICFLPDLDIYKERRGLLLELTDLPVEIVTDVNEIAERAQSALAKSQIPSSSKLARRLTELEDGRATSRVLDLLDETHPRVTSEKSQKKRVLLYPGGFMMNGITSAVTALLEALDYEQFEVHLIGDVNVLDKNVARRERLASIPRHVNVVLRSASTPVLYSETFAYHRYLHGQAKASDLPVVKEIFAREAQRIFGQNHFDIAIQYSGYSPFWTGLFSAVPSTRKFIFQHNDMLGEWKNPHPKRNHGNLSSVFSMYRYFDKVVSVSEELLSINQENMTKAGYQVNNWDYCRNFIPAVRMKAPTGAELESLLPDVVKSIIANSQTRRFVHIGRFSPEKNHETLVRAFDHVISASSEEVHLFLVGTGPLETEIKKLVSELGLQDRIHFLGVLENPIGVLSVSECLLLPSQYEGQPIVILEALALGKTVVATRFPSLNPFMEHVSNLVIDIGFTQDDLVRGILDTLGRESASQAWEGLFDYKEQVRQDISRLLETDSA